MDAAESHRILDAFVDRGFALIDTADTYSTWVEGHRGGELETIIGDWLKATGKREQALIATKVGGAMTDVGKGLSKAQIIRSAEDLLRRLKTDRIDLYQAHFDDTGVPMEETLEAFSILVKSGKARAIGASNFSAPRLTEALATARAEGLPLYACLQPHYNLVTRAFFEGGLQRLCIEEDLGVIPFRALGAGTPHWQISIDGRHHRQAARRTRRPPSRRPQPRYLTRARWRRAKIECHAGPGRHRLALGPAGRHGAHRERYEPGSARRGLRGGDADARRQDPEAAHFRERLRRRRFWPRCLRLVSSPKRQGAQSEGDDMPMKEEDIQIRKCYRSKGGEPNSEKYTIINIVRGIVTYQSWTTDPYRLSLRTNTGLKALAEVIFKEIPCPDRSAGRSTISIPLEPAARLARRRDANG